MHNVKWPCLVKGALDCHNSCTIFQSHALSRRARCQHKPHFVHELSSVRTVTTASHYQTSSWHDKMTVATYWKSLWI